MSINKVILMGRLTFEPELKATPSGVAVIRFQIACDRNYQAKGKERKEKLTLSTLLHGDRPLNLSNGIFIKAQ